MSLTLEAGKDYRTEDGSRVTLYAHDNNAWPFTNRSKSEFWSNGIGASSHSFNGRCYGDKFGNRGSGQNIVAVWSQDPPDAANLARAADALEAIAASLATIAQHLAPVITGAPALIPWFGGSNPFSDASRVEVQYRNGLDEIGPANGFRWAHDVHHPYDIVAYRLAPAK